MYNAINIYPDIKGKFAAIEVKFSFEKMAESVRVLDNIDDDISLLTDFLFDKNIHSTDKS